MGCCAGDIQLGTHGGWYDFNGKARFGGVLTDSGGNWLFGYYGQYGANSEPSLEAEIWAIYRGLVLIERTQNADTLNLKVNSDSLPAIKLIYEGPPMDHPNRAMIADSKILLDRTGAVLKTCLP